MFKSYIDTNDYDNQYQGNLPTNIWECLRNDYMIVHACKTVEDSAFFTHYHDTFNITVVQWLLWYIGSGARTFRYKKYGDHNRKDWAMFKLRLIHDNLPADLWKTLVKTPTGFSPKCTTIHFFTRNSAFIEKEEHLKSINNWLDEAGARITYAKDEYGYTPTNYLYFREQRKQKFLACKDQIDGFVNEYHKLENELDNMLKKLKCNHDYFFDWLKEIGETNEIGLEVTPELRSLILKICKARVNSHALHENIFGKDQLSRVEKLEEESNRSISQQNNHLWIIRTYRLIIAGSLQEKYLNEHMKFKKVSF